MLDNILKQRHNTYGLFMSQALLTQTFKEVARRSVNYEHMDADQKEALDMIFSKVARILNGNPNYADSWVDIAGYAKLVSDRLDGLLD
jgi:hypothetical protein